MEDYLNVSMKITWGACNFGRQPQRPKDSRREQTSSSALSSGQLNLFSEMWRSHYKTFPAAWHEQVWSHISGNCYNFSYLSSNFSSTSQESVHLSSKQRNGKINGDLKRLSCSQSTPSSMESCALSWATLVSGATWRTRVCLPSTISCIITRSYFSCAYICLVVSQLILCPWSMIA